MGNTRQAWSSFLSTEEEDGSERGRLNGEAEEWLTVGVLLQVCKLLRGEFGLRFAHGDIGGLATERIGRRE